MREFVGTFDEGGYVHLVFVPDEFDAIAKAGLADCHELAGMVRDRVQGRAAALAGEQRCKRGLTILVHGGIGRECSPIRGDLPHGWHQLCVSAPDFMLLGSRTDFTAMRAWKLLQQVEDLETRGVVFPTLRGFLNLAAFAYHVGFEIVPENMKPSPIYLHSDFILPLRHELRIALDRHAALSSDGEKYVGIQREATDGRFDDFRGPAVFVSPAHRGEGEVLACVESVSRPWWIQCSQIPEDWWHRGLVFGVLDLILGWLVRLVPVLEADAPRCRRGPSRSGFDFRNSRLLANAMLRWRKRRRRLRSRWKAGKS